VFTTRRPNSSDMPMLSAAIDPQNAPISV